MIQNIDRAIQAIKSGKMVIIYDSEDREGEGDLAFAGKFSTPELVNFCIKKGGGLVCLSMTNDWANRIGVRRQSTNSKDTFETPFGNPINCIGLTSGISAQDRSNTIRQASESFADHTHFYYPGHVHTLIAHPQGLFGRKGHTEAVLDLLKISKIEGPGVLCEILNAKGEAATLDELKIFEKEFAIPLIFRDWIHDYLIK